MQALIESVGALGSKERKALAALLRQQGLNLFEIAPVFRRLEDEPLRLSYAQERQWFLWQLDPAGAAYHIPMALRLRGQLDRSALQLSFDHLVARHESLRTTFWQNDGDPLQVVGGAGHVAIEVQPFAEGAVEEVALRRRVEQIVILPFDLGRGPLLRVVLLRLGEDDHVLVMVQHHIVSDAVSMRVTVEELLHLYAGYSQGREVSLAQLPIQYADYAIWQRSWMEAGEKERQLGYWLERLGREQPVMNLPIDHARAGAPSHRGARLVVPLDKALHERLSTLARHEGATLFMLLLASFHALLYRYSGQCDIRVGVPIANRNRVETERLVGFFVNTLVLQANVDGQMTLRDLLRQTRQRALEAQAHQDLPFEQLVEALRPERSLSHSPLFQVMFNHLRGEAGHGAATNLPGLAIEAFEWTGTTAQFDLALNVYETDRSLDASFNYASDLFEASTIERMARHWRNLLQAFVERPQQRVCELPMLDEAEQGRLLSQGDFTHADYPSHRPVHAWIEDQAAKSPQARALTFGDTHMTYAQLDGAANGLAHRLVELGVGPEVRVAIAMRRCADIMVAFLAVLKAGGAYVPMDVEYPSDRLSYMLRDSQAALVLTQSHVLESLPLPSGMPTLALDGDDTWRSYRGGAPAVALHEDNLAYVIYTSGSTGLPKGVAVSHGPLAMHCLAVGERYEMTPSDCELHFMSFAFDGAHEGWMHPLMYGARLLIRDDSLWPPEQTYEAMRRHGVTVGVFPPLYLQQLAEYAEWHGDPPAVRVYCFGGDAMPRAAYELAWRTLRPRYLFNGYGPTETVVTPLIWKARPGDACGAAYAPIGHLIGKRRGLILDAELNLLPAGMAGELYLGGMGLARGYLDRPALTAERFVPDPFDVDGGRFYRSGDLTRLRSDGVVDYLGRMDHQVKVRGFRIELGEIEARLGMLEGVRESVVLAKDGPSGKLLVGYVVPASSAVLDDRARQSQWRERIREALKAQLPDYMVPTQLLFLAHLPVTPNGKLDRGALPTIDVDSLLQNHVAPRNAVERQLVAIWQDVLGCERVGVEDNFFERGGDSLLALKVLGRINKETTFGQAVKLRDLMGKPTIGELAASLGEGAGERSPLLLLNRFLPGKTPVFAFHMLYGTVLDYRALARRLDGRRSLYGIQSRMLLDVDWKDLSLQAMAQDYVKCIRQQQPEGPYLLLGWSLGGTLALLAAHELERQGQRVDFLGLVDTFLPGDGYADAISLEEHMAELKGFLSHIFGQVPTDAARDAVVDGAIDELALGRLIARLQQSSHPDDLAYAALSADELARSFSIGMQLRALCGRQAGLPDVQADVCCWWADNARAMKEREAFEHGIRGLRLSRTLGVSHQAIVQDQDVLCAVYEVLQQYAD